MSGYATCDGRFLSATPGSGRQLPKARTPEVADRSDPLELGDFVLDAELLALQIGDRILVWKGTANLLIDGVFQFCVLCFERLDAIPQRHARSSFQTWRPLMVS